MREISDHGVAGLNLPVGRHYNVTTSAHCHKSVHKTVPGRKTPTTKPKQTDVEDDTDAGC